MEISERPKVEFNITELCDLVCNFCPRASGYPNKNLNATIETAEIIADQILNWNPDIEVTFSGRGEPTLHPQFDKIANVFLDRNIKLRTHTNGARLDRYLDVLSKFDRVTYSIYTDNEDEYFKTFKKYESFIKKLNWARIDQVSSNGMWRWRWDTHKNKFIDRNISILENRAGTISIDKFPFINMKNSCDYLEWFMFIDYNGNYNLCSDDWTPERILGNVRNETLKEFWYNNKQLNEFRKGIETGHRLSPCNVCSQ